MEILRLSTVRAAASSMAVANPARWPVEHGWLLGEGRVVTSEEGVLEHHHVTDRPGG